MTGEKWALAACVVFSGLWSRLLAMLTLVMHPMLAAMDGRYFTRILRGFLPTARRSWFNYLCIFGMLLAWDSEALPADWEATRRRCFTLNRVRAAMTWTAFALFLVALVAL